MMIMRSESINALAQTATLDSAYIALLAFHKYVFFQEFYCEACGKESKSVL